MEKKYYQVAVKTGLWKNIHELLCEKTCKCDYIPDRQVECYDLVDHSDSYAYYLLTDEEADLLKNHPDVVSVSLDSVKYPELRSETHYAGTIKRQYDPIYSNLFQEFIEE